ncbi:MAG: diacylglycerol kinase catalytic region [Solirubrobacterales bacterium]|nr:diacylglycerol kinase catalytic region [Solirubrobacterales bacterium]
MRPRLRVGVGSGGRRVRGVPRVDRFPRGIAVLAEVASERGLPYACVPPGTRNHFALDLGVDRDDVFGAFDAFVAGGEKRVDVARLAIGADCAEEEAAGKTADVAVHIQREEQADGHVRGRAARDPHPR